MQTGKRNSRVEASVVRIVATVLSTALTELEWSSRQSRECRQGCLYRCSQLIPPQLLSSVSYTPPSIALYLSLSEASPRVITLVEDMGSDITEHSLSFCCIAALPLSCHLSILLDREQVVSTCTHSIIHNQVAPETAGPRSSCHRVSGICPNLLTE